MVQNLSDKTAAFDDSKSLYLVMHSQPAWVSRQASTAIRNAHIEEYDSGFFAI